MIQRKTEPEPFVATSGDRDGAIAGGQVHGVTAQEWMFTWGPKLNESLSGYLEATAFDLPTTFAMWNSGSSAAFAKAMWAPIAALTGKGQPYATLIRLLAPDPLDSHINAGRDAAVAEKQDPLGNGIQPRGDRSWAGRQWHGKGKERHPLDAGRIHRPVARGYRDLGSVQHRPP